MPIFLNKINSLEDLICVLGGITFLYSGLKSLARIATIWKWPRTTATIYESFLEGGFGGAMRYPKIRYSYFVQEQQYSASATTNTFIMKRLHWKVKDEFPAGKVIPIVYKASNPAISFPEPKYLLIIGDLVWVILGFLFLFEPWFHFLTNYWSGAFWGRGPTNH